jgi:hypothetical protein
MRLMRRAQHGFVAAYLIGAIALFSVVAYAMSQMYDANAEARWRRQQADSVYEQTQLIRKQVVACGVKYPNGDNGDLAALDYYRKYPRTWSDLSYVECPGAPSTDRGLFTGKDGIFLKQLPPDFGGWSYANNGWGIRVSMRANTPRGIEVLSRLAQRIGPNEASQSGDVFTFIVAAP